MRAMRPWAVLGLVLGVAACAAAEQAPQGVALPAGTLDGAELRALFEGRTALSVTLGSGRESLSYYDPGGELRQRRDGQMRLGRWRIRDDARICLAMEGGDEQCRIIVREPDGSYRKYVVKLSGDHRPVIIYPRFFDGNPEGL